MDSVRLEKLALFCNVPKENIIINPDIDHVYRLPLLFEEQGFGKKILDRFGLEPKEDSLGDWRRISERFSKVKKSVRVGMIGKYINVGDFQLADSYVSVNEAIKHAAAELGAKAEIVWMNAADLEKDASRIDDVDCVIVPGGFGSSGIEGKINAIKYCRENDIPFLGLCLGLQMAVVEYARNVCGLNGAHSTEMDRKTAYPVIDILPEQKGVTKKGGTMRLGGYPAVLRKGSIVRRLYEEAGRMDGESAVERHRHRYEVNPDYIGRLQENGLVVSGLSPDGKLTEFIELPRHRYFVATQSHPEFTSWPGRPNPLFYGLIRAAIEK